MIRPELLRGRWSVLRVKFNRCLASHSVLSIANQMRMFNQQKQFRKTLRLFDTYTNDASAPLTSMIINQAIKACTQTRDLQRGEQIHRLISTQADDPYVVTSLIHLYMQCGKIEMAESLFEQCRNKDVTMFNAMMKGYITHKKLQQAIDIFRQVKHPSEVTSVLLFNACAQAQTKEALELIKDVSSKMPKSSYFHPVTMAALADALMKCADVNAAESLFLEQKTSSLSLYAAMIAGYVNNHLPFQAVSLFKQMMRKELLLKDDHRGLSANLIESNRIVYLTVINALADYADLSTAEFIIEQISTSFLVHPHIRNALIYMWGKVGSVDKAKDVFSTTRQPDYIGYTAMINTYGLNGMGQAAVELFDCMANNDVDETALICVLNACSHSGLIDEARRIFLNATQPTLKVYVVMVDCLCRAALFDEAKQLIEQFEKASAPSLTMHMALLSGCRNCQKTDLAKEVYNRIIERFPEARELLVPATVLLANTVASSGNLDQASDVRMQLHGKKTAGLSWTTVNGQFYEFCAHDRSHPRSTEIYAEVERMMDEAVRHGHQYDARWLTRPLKSGETIASVLGGHSEKLAIAWNFIENPRTARIQLAKNLRVYGDCHSSTKLIAIARQCDIIVRDANRIHHFGKDGRCSCNDYF